jgi:predicted ATPase/DNA-binding NarL/FixJ family response regulator
MTASSVIGRDDDVARVLDGLADGDRWITLVGPGGVGKTTVARVVQRQWGHHGGAALFVACDKWVDASSLMSLLAEEVGGDATSNAMASIARLFGDGDTILVLDNVEHLAGAFGDIADLVDSDERIRLVCTSRIAARLPNERVINIEPLGHCAIELLADRIESAGAPRPDSTDPALSTLCDLVDRLPLGIELAAARVPTFGLSGLVDVLSKNYRSLDQNRPRRRHNSVIDTVADTYGLIDSPDTRQLYRRLGVFSGPFTLAAAAAVEVATTSPATADAATTLPASIAALAELQLLVRDSDVPTYRMLATVREHARELLGETDELAEVNEALLGWVDRITTNALVDVDGEHVAWLERVRQNYPVIRDGLTLAALDTRNVWLTRFVERLRPYWLPLRLVREAHSWAVRSSELGHGNAAELAMQLFHLAVFSYHVEGPQRARAYAQRGLAVAGVDQGTRLYGRLLDSAALTAADLGDFEDAEVHQRRAIDLYDQLGEHWLHAGGLLSLGRMQLARGRTEAAMGYITQAMSSYDGQGKVRSMASTRAVLAEAMRQGGDAVSAVILLDDSIAAQLAVDDRTTATEAMVWRIEALVDCGRHDEAARRSAELVDFVGDDGVRQNGALLVAVLRAQAATLSGDEVVRRAWAAIATCADTAVVAELIAAIELAGQLATLPASRRALMAAANALREQHAMARPSAVVARLIGSDDAGAFMASRDELQVAVARMFAQTLAPPSGHALVHQQPLIDPLTPRELEVLGLVAEGLRDKEIATRLYLSVRTVNGYVARVFTKLDASSRLSAVNAARRLGLIDSDPGLVGAL